MSLIVDAIVNIQRLTRDTDNADKEQYQDNAALQAVHCNIQPATASETAIAEGIFGQVYTMYTTESGILTGDRVTVSGTGQTYRVRGLEDWSQTDGIPHYELTLIKMEDEEVIS